MAVRSLGTDGRLYPWGADLNQSNFPVETNCPLFLGPEPVTAHVPAGDSIFAVSDLVGNVWQYTDEFQDEHSRYVILRGGSNYRPSGSSWYFLQAKELNKHNSTSSSTIATSVPAQWASAAWSTQRLRRSSSETQCTTASARVSCDGSKCDRCFGRQSPSSSSSSSS